MPSERDRIEQRLRRLSRLLSKSREDLRVANEQLGPLQEAAEDLRVRALVSDSPLYGRLQKRAERHVQRLEAHRNELRARVGNFEAEQNELLDRLLEARR